MKNILKQCFKHLDNDQMAVVKSTLTIVGIVLGLTLFIEPCPGYFFIIVPLQGILTSWFFCNNEIIEQKDGTILDIKSKKSFKKSISYAFALSGLPIFGVAMEATDLVGFNSIWVVLILLLPLIITRSIVYFFKLPLTVLYAVIRPLNADEREEGEKALHPGWKSLVGNIHHDR